MPAAALLILAGVLLHWALVQALASAWLAPDLTLVSVVWVCARHPRQGWLAGMIAGLLTMGWMPESSLLPLAGYLCVALSVQQIAAVWNMSDWRAQAIVVGLFEIAWVALQLSGLGVRWAEMGSLGLVHVGVTLLAAATAACAGEFRRSEFL